MKHEERMTYHNPQCIRKNWTDLCGEWDFEFDPQNMGLKEHWYESHEFSQKIKVPFAYQSPLSGLEEKENIPVVWYKKRVEIPLNEERILLHFQAVDFSTRVWVNGHNVYSHQGGFVPFKIDITDYVVSGLNDIVVRVEDITSSEQILGKQSWKDENFLCWYTKTTGIWQPVWMEIVPQNYIDEFYLVPNIEEGTLDIEIYTNPVGSSGQLQVDIAFNERKVAHSTIQIVDHYGHQRMYIQSDDPNFRLHYWTPEDPNLYDITLSYRNGQTDDVIYSYIGMRAIDSREGDILLNNEVFYQKLILNQGYYAEGLMTPPDVNWFVEDILKTKKMGFNGMRIHQKVEEHKFLYLCDYYGLVLWAEMPSFYKFNRFSKRNYLENLEAFIRKHYNHPSVIVWTLFNESWGVNGIYGDQKQQQFVNAIFELTKSMDSTRMVIGNDGWEHTRTDILSIHDYTSEPEQIKQQYAKIKEKVNGSLSMTSSKYNYCKGYQYEGEPILLSEFGGVAYTQSKEVDNAWGYGERLKTEEDVIEKISTLMKVVMEIDGVCGFCYTQLSDVEQEINGLLDHQHEYKFSQKKIKDTLNTYRSTGFVFE